MKSLWNQLRALVLLGIQALLLQPIRRLRNLKSSGESRFLAAYTPDRLLPLTREELERRDRLGACVHCGLCDAGCEELARARRSRLPSLSTVAMGYSRSMSEYPYATPSLDELGSCDGCADCEEMCPMGVPLKEMVEDVRSHAGRLVEAGAGVDLSALTLGDDSEREAPPEKAAGGGVER